MSEFTKGPWLEGWGNGVTGPSSAHKLGWDGQYPIRSTIEHGLYGTVACVHVKDDNYLANARLIAAAPEMYEAIVKCIETFEFFEKIRGSKGSLEDAEVICRAALAKAKGESNETL